MDEFWDSQDVFELQHGAYLLSGLYPPDTHEPKLPPKVKAALDRLEFEIKAGRLEVLHWEYPSARRVRRGDLQRLAEQQDYHPATLFPDRQPAQTTAEASTTKYDNLLRAFGLLVRAYVERGGGQFGTIDNPNKSQIAGVIEHQARKLNLLEDAATGLRSSTIQNRITEAWRLLGLDE